MKLSNASLIKTTNFINVLRMLHKLNGSIVDWSLELC